MSNSKVYSIGEALIDITINKGFPEYLQVGGSVVNTSISLARLGKDVSLIAEVGSDEFADVIKNQLQGEGINTDYLLSQKDCKTSVAFAFVNEKGNATYSIYKDLPGEYHFCPMDQINAEDIIMFGSYYAVAPRQHNAIIKMVSAAKEKNATIIFDPNVRKKVHKSLPHEVLKENISRCIQVADITKASDEDFNVIFETNTPEEAYHVFKELGGQYLIYTQGAKEVYLFTPDFLLTVDVPQVEVVNTIGAGDNFNAGMIYSLLTQSKAENIKDFSRNKWSNLLKNGITLATTVCQTKDNYIPVKAPVNMLSI